MTRLSLFTAAVMRNALLMEREGRLVIHRDEKGGHVRYEITEKGKDWQEEQGRRFRALKAGNS